MESMGSGPDWVLHACLLQFAGSAVGTVWGMICSVDRMGCDLVRVLHALLLQFAGSAVGTVWGPILIGYCMFACYSLPALQLGQYGVSS